MRVLHIVRFSEEYPGGAEKVAFTLAKYLDKKPGWKSGVVWFKRYPKPIEKIVKNYIIPSPSRLSKVFERFSPEIVHIHALRNGYAIESALLSLKFGVPYILQTHGACATERDSGFLGFIKKTFDNSMGRFLLNRAAAVIALTNLEATAIKKIASKANVRVIPNGIEKEDLKKPPKKKIEEFKEMAHGDYTLVTVARIHPVKSIPEIIPAIAFAQEKIEGKITYIIGGPDEGDLHRVLDTAKKYNVDVVVVGEVRGEEKRALIAAGDAFLLPSRYEGFPLTLLEAMAQGTTPVVSDRGGSKEIVKNLGYVFRYGDIHDGSEKIVRALKNPVNKKELVSFAKQFLWEKIIERYYIPLLEDLLGDTKI